MEELLFGLRILADLALSAVLGFCIGLERKLRYKEAGIRTHTIEGFLYCLILEKEKSHRYQLKIFSTGKKKILQIEIVIINKILTIGNRCGIVYIISESIKLRGIIWSRL